MMKMLILVVPLALAGCLVQSGPSRGPVARESRSCGPAYHWEGGTCVHNGNGRGNGHGHGH